MSKRKKFAFAAALTGATAAAVTAGMFVRHEVARRRPFVIEEASIADLQKAMKLGMLTAKQLTDWYLERIQHFSKLHAIIEINPQALRDAEASDVKRMVKPDVGPLFGIPVVVKDNIKASGMHTTVGAFALKDYCPSEDAFLVSRLKAAGAIIIGKANLTEFANFISESMPDGFSTIGGQTLNPYDSACNVGGSSSGSAVAVAANLAAAAIGTETSGSILDPAAANAVVGIKPTVGLISRSGIVPIAHSQDTAGTLAKTVYDAALLLSVIAGLDEEDEETVWSQGEVKKDYTVFLKSKGLRGARVGIDRSFLAQESEEATALIDRALQIMRTQGAAVVDPIAIPSADTLEHRYSSVLQQEFHRDINHFLSDLPESLPVHSLPELIAYNQAHAGDALAYGQAVFEQVNARSGDLSERSYLVDRADDIRLSRKEGIDAVMRTHHLDALLFIDSSGADLAAKAGYPSITVPAGFTASGVPVGLTFTGMAFSEPRLLELAYAFEQTTHFRRAPQLEQ
ncbi:MAG: amidase family protein [Sporolactobacillus sp.]